MTVAGRKLLGDILIEQGVVSKADVGEALAVQNQRAPSMWF